MNAPNFTNHGQSFWNHCTALAVMTAKHQFTSAPNTQLSSEAQHDPALRREQRDERGSVMRSIIWMHPATSQNKHEIIDHYKELLQQSVLLKTRKAILMKHSRLQEMLCGFLFFYVISMTELSLRAHQHLLLNWNLPSSSIAYKHNTDYRLSQQTARTLSESQMYCLYWEYSFEASHIIKLFYLNKPKR